MQQRYNQVAPAAYRLQRPDELASFFDGLDLVEPGVVPCPQWKPDVRSASGGASGGASGRASGGGAPGESAAYCGVARKH
jgi:hypothetical protein